LELGLGLGLGLGFWLGLANSQFLGADARDHAIQHRSLGILHR